MQKLLNLKVSSHCLLEVINNLTYMGIYTFTIKPEVPNQGRTSNIYALSIPVGEDEWNIEGVLENWVKEKKVSSLTAEEAPST